MAYTTLENLQKVKPIDELTQLTDGSGTPNTDKINQAISKAGIYIDGFLSGSVFGWEEGVGVDPFPPLITEIATDLSIFFLYNIKYGENISVYEEKGIYKRYQMAIELLKNIKNKILTVTATEKIQSDIIVEDIDQVFTTDILDGF